MGHLTWYSNHIIVLVILQCFSNKVSRFDLSGCNLWYLTKIGLKLTLDFSFENQCDFTITWLILWAQFGQVTTWFWSVCVNSQIFGTHLTAWQIMKTEKIFKIQIDFEFLFKTFLPRAMIKLACVWRTSATEPLLSFCCVKFFILD